MKCPLAALSVLALCGCAAVPGEGSPAGVADLRLARCGEVQGTLAVDDGRRAAWWRPFTRRTGVTTIAPLIRLMAERSGCFAVTATGNGRTDALRARAGGRRREATDYFLETAIALPDRDTRPAAPDAPATVTLLLVAVRGGQQLATTTGAATAAPYAVLLASLGEDRDGTLARYGRTADGRAAVAALAVAFNSLVSTARSDSTVQTTRP